MLRKRSKRLPFENLVDAAYDHIVVTDPHGKILYANPAVSTTTGYAHTEVIGQTPRLWGGLMPESFYKNFWKTIKHDKKPFVGEVKNRRKDGTVYTAGVRVSPVLDTHGNIKYFIGIERDITALKQLDSSRNEFISLVSHQLRTPLSTLNWYSESLVDGDSGKLKKEQQEYVSEIYDATQRMIKLVNDLLNSTRIDFGNIKLQETKIDLYELFRDILRDCKVAIDKKHLVVENNISKQGTHYIYSDQPSLYVVFENIITNAIKYTPKKGVITIDLSQTKTEYLISIQDTGYGIDAGDKNKIFTKYFRSEQIKKFSTEGTGLGLFITKSYVTAMGGSIRYESTEKGTTFFVTVPKKLVV